MFQRYGQTIENSISIRSDYNEKHCNINIDIRYYCDRDIKYEIVEQIERFFNEDPRIKVTCSKID